MADYTLTYNDSVNPDGRGWTSFWSFIPDGMLQLNNEFYTFKDGQLYRHNASTVNRNNFYGVDYPSRVTVVMNDSPSEVKVIKTLSQEGTAPWDAVIRAFESDQDEYRESALVGARFDEREGMWYAYVRKAESGTTLGAGPFYGIGTLTNVTGADFTLGGFSRLPMNLAAGDLIYKEGGILLGTLVDREINSGDLRIGIDDSGGGDVSQGAAGNYIYGAKNARIDGAEMRGYVFEIALENNDTVKRELFSVNGEVIKSHQ